MASAAGTNDLLKSLQNTVNCSVCRDIFKDPVTLHCGHNFCRFCITQRWEGLKRNFPCPQCRKRFRKGTMRPNSQLEEIAKQIPAPAVKGSEGEKLCETHKKAKQVQALAVKGSEGEKMCEKHKKPWMLFCEDDKELTCMDCRMSYKHRGHNVLSIEDAAKVYKHEIHLKLNYFKKEKERMLTLKTNEGKKIDTLLTQTATERKEITSYFGQQHQILKYEEQCLMEKLDEIDQTILKRKYKWFAGFMEIMLPIENAISNIEETCQQPEIEFLKNVESTRSGYSWYFDGMTPDVRDEVKDLNPILSDIEKDFCCFSKKFKVLKESLMLNKVNMTLCQRHSELGAQKHKLIISEDGKSVSGHEVQGFDPSCYVLGSEGFSAGRHYWEVEVRNGFSEWKWEGYPYFYAEEWAIGVARESMTHKTPSDLIPEEGIWCVWMSQDTIHPSYWDPHYQTPAITAVSEHASSEAPLDQTPATSPAPVVSGTTPALATPTTLGPIAPATTPGPMTLDTAHCPKVAERQRKIVKRIRVCLDYERGWVTFYRTDNMAAPITYCTSFTEKIFPIFWVCSYKTQLRLCPNDCSFRGSYEY